MLCAATPPVKPLAKTIVMALATGLLLVQPAVVAGQSPAAHPHLKNLGPSGLRDFMSDSYGTIGFGLVNPSDQDIQVRVLTFFAGAEGKQYGRDVWSPAHSVLSSWFSIGPCAEPPARSLMELKSLLYDRSDKQEHLIRSPEGQPLHSDLVRYEKREPTTSIILDADIDDGSQTTVSADENLRAIELRELARVFRHQGGLSSRLSSIKNRYLPPIPEAFDGVDQIVLGSNRLADDAAGQRALRAWLERGGALWIPLDVVQEETVKALLGDMVPLHIVDRTSVTSVHFEAASPNVFRPEPETREFEEPIAFVQVVAPEQQAYFTVDGWPAAFAAQIGRGRVLFTALGPRGWVRPRADSEPRSRMKEFPNLPVALRPFQYLAEEFQLQSDRALLGDDDLRTYAKDQISYTVVSRTMVLLVFGILFAVLAMAAVVFSRRGLLEHLGWLGPAVALGTACIFVGLGERSRGAVPPTVAMAQVVQIAARAEAPQVTGYLGAYHPNLDQATIGAQEGGQFDLDMIGLEGRTHARVQTDATRWHWENLEFPAGLRLAPFQYQFANNKPIAAIIRFGPGGALGQMNAESFRELEDPLLITPGRHALPVTLAADHTFLATTENGLQTGQLIASGLLNDRQRTRQRLYEKLLADPWPRCLGNRSHLLAWSEPIDMHFTLVEGARLAGSSLLVIPVRYERTPPGASVLVPAAFVACQKVDADGHLQPAAAESRLPATVRLRFQLPPSVLPLAIEKARLQVKLQAPAREVTLKAASEGVEKTLRVLNGPNGVEQFDIENPQLLEFDDQGVWYLNVIIGPIRGNAEHDTWRMEWPGLEVGGKT